MSFYEKWEIVSEISIDENSKWQDFFISEETAPKTDKIFNFLPYIQRAIIPASQVRHPNFL